MIYKILTAMSLLYIIGTIGTCENTPDASICMTAIKCFIGFSVLVFAGKKAGIFEK